MATLIITTKTCHKCRKKVVTSEYNPLMKLGIWEPKSVETINRIPHEESCCGAGWTELWDFIEPDCSRIIIWAEEMMPDCVW